MKVKFIFIPNGNKQENYRVCRVKLLDTVTLYKLPPKVAKLSEN